MTGAIDVAITAVSWRSIRGAKRVVTRAISACRGRLGRAGETAETSIVLCDDAEIRRLNRAFRGKDKATNVLSFPAAQSSGYGGHLGDIAIAFETVAREASAEGKSATAHLSHMAVHGYLHLAGYDHEDDADAEAMEAMEREVLASLGIEDPYLDRQSREDGKQMGRQVR
jgi:probable rRNA maturation factor